MNAGCNQDQEWSSSWQNSYGNDEQLGQATHQTLQDSSLGFDSTGEQPETSNRPRWLPIYDEVNPGFVQKSPTFSAYAYQPRPGLQGGFVASPPSQPRHQLSTTVFNYSDANSYPHGNASVQQTEFGPNWLSTQFRRAAISRPIQRPFQHVTVTKTRPTSQGDVPYTYSTPAIIGSGQNESEREQKLYPNFRRNPKPRRFFKFGKVFLTLWTEPAGDNNSGVGSTYTAITSGVSAGSYGEAVFSKIRRFIVVREGTDSCTVLPIKTYGGKGVSKRGVRKCEHAIVYTGKVAPLPQPEEAPSRKERGLLVAIRVDGDSPEQKLDVMSRIDFGKVYTIEHNVKVCSMGMVNRASESALLYQLKIVWESTMGKSTIEEPDEKKDIMGTNRPSSSPSVLEWIDAYNLLIANAWTEDQALSVLKSNTHSTMEPKHIPCDYDGDTTSPAKKSGKRVARRVAQGQQHQSPE